MDVGGTKNTRRRAPKWTSADPKLDVGGHDFLTQHFTPMCDSTVSASDDVARENTRAPKRAGNRRPGYGVCVRVQGPSQLKGAGGRHPIGANRRFLAAYVVVIKNLVPILLHVCLDIVHLLWVGITCSSYEVSLLLHVA